MIELTVKGTSPKINSWEFWTSSTCFLTLRVWT